MSSFSGQIDTFFAEFFGLNPLAATAAGMHDHDHEWPDLTEAGRVARLAFAERWAGALAAIPAGELDRDEAVDRTLLLLVLDEMRFEDAELRQLAWDPLEWVYVLGAGIFPLLAREFAPLAERLASIAGRLEGLPAVVEAARASLVGTPDGRPVSRFHTETALSQLPGISELIGDALAEAETAAPDDPAVAAILERVRSAARAATEAVGAAEAFLRDEVLPRSAGEGRLGPELFAAKLRRTLRDAELTPARILDRASAGGRCGPGRDGPPGPRHVAGLVPQIRRCRPMTASWFGPSSTRSPPSTRRPPTCSTSAGRSSSGSRSSAARRTSSACRRSRSRSAGHRSSCGRSGARCSTRRVRSTVARRASSRSPRSPTTGRPSRPRATCARTTTGCSGS